MKKTLFIVTLLAALCVPVARVSAADIKVGFVNVAKVLEEAPQAEDARAKLEKEFAPRDRDLVAAQKALRKLEDKMVRDGAVMSDENRTKLELDVRSRKREIKRQQDEFREDLNLRRNQELASLQTLVLDAIQSLAKAENYDIIVGDGVIFASSRVDISAKVIDRLKQAFKGSAKKK